MLVVVGETLSDASCWAKENHPKALIASFRSLGRLRGLSTDMIFITPKAARSKHIDNRRVMENMHASIMARKGQIIEVAS